MVSLRMKPDSESVKAWIDWLGKIDNAVKELGCEKSGQECWFRGHSDGDKYRLLPSLFRHFKKPNKESNGDWDAARQLESDLFYDFSTRARELHTSNISDWDILFAMQHHGTPTRLLDWTEIFGVALYFALLGVDEEVHDTAEPCVWLLNPYRLNKLSWGCADIVYPPYLGWDERIGEYWEYGELVSGINYLEWDLPVAIYPRQQNQRMHSQRAWFTIHGDEHVPIESIKKIRKKALRKVPIPLSVVKPARNFLRMAGINHYSLFPDLENLGRHLEDQYLTPNGSLSVIGQGKGMKRKR